MARGRKIAITDIPMLEAYTNELNRLTLLEAEQIKNLEECRAEIKKYKDLILQEEMKELKSIMDEKNISFEELKDMLENREQAEDPEAVTEGTAQ